MVAITIPTMATICPAPIHIVYKLLSVVQEIKLYSLIIALAFFTRKTKRTCITHVPNVSEFPLYFFVGLKRLINPLNVEDVKVPVSSNLNPLFIQMP